MQCQESSLYTEYTDSDQFSITETRAPLYPLFPLLVFSSCSYSLFLLPRLATGAVCYTFATNAVKISCTLAVTSLPLLDQSPTPSLTLATTPCTVTYSRLTIEAVCSIFSRNALLTCHAIKISCTLAVTSLTLPEQSPLHPILWLIPCPNPL